MTIDMRRLGRTDLMVTSCCLGTMTWGEQNTEAEGHAQMDYALDRGINFFDTAELYAIPPKPETQGATEQIIGSWFKARGNREKVILASKITGRSDMAWHRSYPVAETRLDGRAIDDAVENSLKRLQTDYIDLYQLHWPDRFAPRFGLTPSFEKMRETHERFEDTLGHLQRHVDKGHIRHVGLSNETAFGIMRFLAESDAHGLPRVQSVQNAYNLLNRTWEEGLTEITAHEDVGLLAYSPLAQGYLTGKYQGGALPAGSRKALFERLGRYETPNAAAAITAYLHLAAGLGIDPAHLAIKFCDTRPFTTSTIIGATTMEQLKTDIDAFDLEWSDQLEAAVNEIHLRYPSPCP
jgi:aryl-alcohol dehydrogenase-like predicted oxidoreductase